MTIIAIDLGSTNTKAALYSNELELLGMHSLPVRYQRNESKVEFDVEAYFDDIVTLIRACTSEMASRNEKTCIVLTGQAESLVMLGHDGQPLCNGISWLDMRSEKECEELSERFDASLCYQITGQPEIIPTWPITKILWFKNNQTDVFKQVGKFLMIKDYIIYRLTGRYVGEYSIYSFTHYFDITKKCYWNDILGYCGVDTKQLPELVEPCSIAGDVASSVLRSTGLAQGSIVNVGTLDHFAAMIGTGTTQEGILNESAGTVSSIASFVKKPFMTDARLPLYCGPFPNSYILLPVCESGGISLEWFKKAFLPQASFDEINQVCAQRQASKKLTFLPYLTGVNPPEFDHNACGTFFGIRLEHDAYDFALAIMFGVASLIRKNIDYFQASAVMTNSIVSTGGGAKSALWSQIKADMCNLPVMVPENQEAACLGAGIIGAVTAGYYDDYLSAIHSTVKIKTIYNPNPNRAFFEDKYMLFCQLYDALTPMFVS